MDSQKSMAKINGNISICFINFNYQKTISVVIKTYRDNKLYSEYVDYITPENVEQKKQFKRFTYTR